MWLPQIVKNFRKRSRRGPGFTLAIAMFITQSTLLVYLKIKEQNFLEVKADIPFAKFLLCFMLL
jgi:hypothetical protein